MEEKHRHKKHRIVMKNYTRCVAPLKCTHSAHGYITWHEVCLCGAVRLINTNKNYKEVGKWEKLG